MRSKRFDKFTKLLVTWDDIVSDSSWHDEKALAKACTSEIKTLGFFIDNKKRQLRIAHSVAEDGGCDVTCIPWGVVKEVQAWPLKTI